MFKKISGHSAYYISLVAIFSLSFLLAYSSPSRSFQIGVVIATTCIYILWGMIHHLVNHDLHLKIVIEYTLIGIFGLTTIFFLLTTNGRY